MSFLSFPRAAGTDGASRFLVSVSSFSIGAYLSRHPAQSLEGFARDLCHDASHGAPLSRARFKLPRASAVRATRGPPSAPRKRHTETASARDDARGARARHGAVSGGESVPLRPSESGHPRAPCLLRSRTSSTTRRCGVRSTTRPNRARRRARRRSRRSRGRSRSRTAIGRRCLTCRTRPDRRGTRRTKTNNRLSRPPGAPRSTCAPRATVGMRIPASRRRHKKREARQNPWVPAVLHAAVLTLRSTTATTTACSARARRWRRRRGRTKPSVRQLRRVLASRCASSWRCPRTRAAFWCFCPRVSSTLSSCAC